MKTKFTVKRLIIGCIIFALGLMTLLTLCIPLIKVSDPWIDQLISLYNLNTKTYDSGFTLLDFESDTDINKVLALICGISSLLQLLLSIAAMILAVLSIFIFDNARAKKILCGIAIPCLVFNGLYMIWGLVLNGFYKYLLIFEDGSWGLFSSGDSYAFYEHKTYTLAYLGFILGALLFVAYIVCSLMLKDDMARKETSRRASDVPISATISYNSQDEKQQSDCLTQVNNIAEALKQYKELLDCGIITQEEFDEKKKSILG